MNTGFWRRIGCSMIDMLLVVVTLFIYGIVLIIFNIIGKQSLGMKALKIQYSDPSRAVFLFLLGLLYPILYVMTFLVFAIIDIIRIVKRKGTFLEQWVNCFYTN